MKIKNKIINFLSKLRLFRELDIIVLNELSGLLKKIDLVSGEVIIKQGDPGDSLYIAYSGRLDFKKLMNLLA
ncbi:cyclic nucleotide-binding domain-containing protein [Spirochaetota bacterium]